MDSAEKEPSNVLPFPGEGAPLVEGAEHRDHDTRKREAEIRREESAAQRHEDNTRDLIFGRRTFLPLLIGANFVLICFALGELLQTKPEGWVAATILGPLCAGLTGLVMQYVKLLTSPASKY